MVLAHKARHTLPIEKDSLSPKDPINPLDEFHQRYNLLYPIDKANDTPPPISHRK